MRRSVQWITRSCPPLRSAIDRVASKQPTSSDCQRCGHRKQRPREICGTRFYESKSSWPRIENTCLTSAALNCCDVKQKSKEKENKQQMERQQRTVSSHICQTITVVASSVPQAVANKSGRQVATTKRKSSLSSKMCPHWIFFLVD